MTQQLDELIAEIIEKEEVGTLFLGKGNRCRRVFFSGHAVHLLEAGKQCRFLPPPPLAGEEKVPAETMRDLMARVHYIPQSLAAVMGSSGMLPVSQLAEYLRLEELEELWLIVSKNRGHFVFEEGNVPEEILRPQETPRAEIAARSFAEFLGQRRRETAEADAILPSGEEILVLSERGLEAQKSDKDWVFTAIAELVDGMRTVTQTLRDSPFFPHPTRRLLCRGTAGGWLKKTRFPELRSIGIESMSVQELRKLVPRMEAAIPLAVDDMPLRRALAGVCLRTGNRRKALEQFEKMGNAMLARGERTKALSIFQEALQMEPAAVPIREKMFAIYAGFAQEAFDRNDRAEGRQLLEEAVRYRPHDLDCYSRICSTLEDEAAVLRVAPRLLKIMEGQKRDPELPVRFFRALVERFPDGLDVRKRLVNLLLDGGRRDEGIRELQFLAGNLLDRGATEEAREIYHKIGQLDPECEIDAQTIRRLGSKKLTRRRRRLWTPSRTLLFVLLVVAGIAGYQWIVFDQQRQLDRRAHALTRSPIPTLGSVAHRQLQGELRDALHEYQSFRRRHILGVSAWSTTDTIGQLENRLGLLEKGLQEELTELRKRAERAEMRGRFEESKALWHEIARRGEGTEWKTRAERNLQEIETYVRESRRLLVSGTEACDTGDYEKAFELFNRLLVDYSRAEAAHAVRLPVRLESVPSGARLRSEGRVLGTTPTLVWLDAFESLDLTVERDGFHPRRWVVENPANHVNTIHLEPR